MPPRGTPKRLTHFLCVPLVTATSRPQLQKSLDNLRADAKDGSTAENPMGIPERAIRPIGTIHLTLGVMSLQTPERIAGALALLHSLDISSLLSASSPKSIVTTQERSENEAEALQNITEEKQTPLQTTLIGLHSMHDPTKTSVLYTAPSQPSDHLYAFCNSLRGAFADFLIPESRPLLLHATVFNTVYVPSTPGRDAGQGSGHGKNKPKMAIDARELLKKYEGFVWMKDVRLERLAVCRMGARKVKDVEERETGDEEYIVEGEVDLPIVSQNNEI